MKVLHTIASMGAKFGGTSTATFDLLSALNRLDLSKQDAIDLLASGIQDNSTDHSLAEGCDWFQEVPYDCKTPYVYSRNINSFLEERQYDIYHTNGMWLHVNHATCSTARKNGKPYVITPHGMLYPEALKRNAWKKWPLRKLFFDKDIFNASCIHVTCEAELRHIRELGYKGSIAVIGNPVVSPAITNELSANRLFKVAGKCRIGFLGRLHPLKSVEFILQGASLLPDADIQINIIGSGDSSYEAFLKSESRRLNIEERVHFLGFVSGDEKFKELAKMDALFVPSDMENFGMIIPEALLVGTPVMASLGTPWKLLNEFDCGWWVDNSPQSIASVISSIMAASTSELRTMGLRGRNMVLQHFEASRVASQMFQLYEWLLNKCKKPDFVF